MSVTTITDSCSCGSLFSVSASLIPSTRHDAWLAAHEVCRTSASARSSLAVPAHTRRASDSTHALESNGPDQAPDLCDLCNVGDHLACDMALRREVGTCGCASSRHDAAVPEADRAPRCDHMFGVRCWTCNPLRAPERDSAPRLATVSWEDLTPAQQADVERKRAERDSQ